MSEERFKEAFRRLTSETPDPPAFSDLEIHQATPKSSLTFKPWMVAVGVSLVVMVVVGALGLIREGGSDLAAPDDGLIDYIKLEYTATVNPVCEGGTIVDNGGFDEAIIEIWGPNTDDLTLMVATFPDGSTERSIIEGEPWVPKRAWGLSRSEFRENTNFRVVSCAKKTPDTSSSVSLLDPPYFSGQLPVDFVALPPGEASWDDFYTKTGFVKGARLWRGKEVIEYIADWEGDNDSRRILNIVSFDNPAQVLYRMYEGAVETVGSTRSELTLVTADRVVASGLPFDTEGMSFIVQPGFEVNEDEAQRNCPVTIPGEEFTPPDTHPEHPSGWPDSVWYGSDELWTVLPLDGDYGLRKSVWWSARFPGGGIEQEPDITVTYTLLESRRKMNISFDKGTNAHTAQDGWFMIAGGDPPIQGCWMVTAIYKGASLSYTFYNEYGTPAELIVVPDVVGLTVDRAGNVLHDAMYEASFFDSADPEYEVCAQKPGAGEEINPGAIIGMRTAPAGECDELMNPSLDYNPNFETYTDDDGLTWYATACPDADVLVAAGLEGADALPKKGQTWKTEAEEFVAAARAAAVLNDVDYYLSRVGLVDLEVVPRNGEVWDRDDDGNVVVTQVADFMLKGTITAEFQCPTFPVFYQGSIAMAYVRSTSD